MNQYWKNQQFERIEKIKSNDESWINKELVPELESSVQEILMLIDYYALKFTKDGKISVGETRKISSKDDLSRLKTQIDNINLVDPLFKNEKVEFTNFLKNKSTLKNNMNTLLKLVYAQLLKFLNNFNNILRDKLNRDIMGQIESFESHPNIKNISESSRNKIVKKSNGIVNYGSTYTDRAIMYYKKTSRDLANIIEGSTFNEKSTKDWVKKVKTSIKNKTKKLLGNLKRLVVSEVGTSMLLSSFYLFEESDIKRVQIVCEATACDICSPFDGEILYLSDVRFGANAPKWHPNCRCILIPYV